jgi:DNA-binding protein H-NS
MATLEQIQAKLKKLQTQADALIAKKAQVAVDQIRTLMLKHGLTTEDIEAKAKARRDASAAKGNRVGAKANAAGSLKQKGTPKYQDKKTGATWTGHGRAPAWIANVKDRSKFLVEGGVSAALDAGDSVASKAAKAVNKAATVVHSASSKGQRKGPQPAKYRDPKTGSTWSGRGPAPAWLSSVKDRTRFLIDGASAAASGVVAKKAVVKKATAKKATAVKKVTAGKKTAAKAPAKKAANGVKKALVRKTAERKKSTAPVTEAVAAA